MSFRGSLLGNEAMWSLSAEANDDLGLLRGEVAGLERVRRTLLTTLESREQSETPPGEGSVLTEAFEQEGVRLLEVPAGLISTPSAALASRASARS